LPVSLSGDDVLAPVKEYLAVREEADSQLAAGVESFCGNEGRERYAAAVAKPWSVLADLALDCIDEALRRSGGIGESAEKRPL